MRSVLDRVQLRAGETVLELGPGPGAFTVDAADRLGPQDKLIAVDIRSVPERRGGCEGVSMDFGVRTARCWRRVVAVQGGQGVEQEREKDL